MFSSDAGFWKDLFDWPVILCSGNFYDGNICFSQGVVIFCSEPGVPGKTLKTRQNIEIVICRGIK